MRLGLYWVTRLLLLLIIGFLFWFNLKEPYSPEPTRVGYVRSRTVETLSSSITNRLMPQSAEEAGATTKRSIATKQTIDYVRESESQGALSRSGHAATSKHHYFFRRANNSVRIPKSGKSLDPSFERFEKWLPVFWESLDQDFEMQAIVLEEGIKLAQARRSSMEVLMRVDPETALANAFTSSLLPLLPSQVAEHIERVFDGRGDLEVMGGMNGLTIGMVNGLMV